MSVEECVSPEELAQLFHRYHGVLTGCFDGRTATAPWDQVDSHQRRLLIATARLVLSDLAAKQQAGESHDHKAAAHEVVDQAVDQADVDPAGVDLQPPPAPSRNHRAAQPDPDNRRYFAKPGQAEWGC